ncbi:MAG: barstar family protein [Rikenellaceae bacterium]|nr:barstar family protein [Rikenellaceae bacterium]
MKTFRFDNNLECYDGDAFIVKIDKELRTEEELLNFFYDKFQFPTYFGFNWDALWDVMNDLSWIKQHQVLLVHEMMPCMDDHNMSIYIDLLFDLINNWKEGEIHSVDVVFPSCYRDYVMQFVKEERIRLIKGEM